MKALARLFAAWALCAALSAIAQEKPFQPYVGLPGKDVIWLPAEEAMVTRMLDLAQVTSQDVLMDLGSGDGRTVIGAAKRGARGIGVEYNPDMVALSKRNAEKEGVADRVSLEQGDLFDADLTRATVVTLFLLPSINVKLRPKLLELKPGTRVVSNSFSMDLWQPDRTAHDEKQALVCGFNCLAYLWVIPAKAGGTWQTDEGPLVLQQTFQMITGTLGTGNLQVRVAGKVLGDQVTLSAPGMEFSGKLSGNAIEGTVKGEKNGKWTATRN